MDSIERTNKALPSIDNLQHYSAGRQLFDL